MYIFQKAIRLDIRDGHVALSTDTIDTDMSNGIRPVPVG